MRALLTPIVVPQLNQVILIPGRELLPLFNTGRRVLVESEPHAMRSLAAGRVEEIRQPLVEDERLDGFFFDDRVINAAGGIDSLEIWLKRTVKHCQWPEGDYHHHELVTMKHAPGAMVMCWSCDNKFRHQTAKPLERIAQSNTKAWIIDMVLAELNAGYDRALSVAELCWWAIRRGVSEAITETMAQLVLRIDPEPFLGVYKESDLVPSVPAKSILQTQVDPYLKRQPPAPAVKKKPVLTVQVDPESPQTFFARPKRIRWESLKYLQWVKTQPCECCGNPADDAHHLIGWGQGGIGTKAHDILTIPLCRKHHDALHRDPKAFEQEYGTQPEMIIKLLDRAYALGVLA